LYDISRGGKAISADRQLIDPVLSPSAAAAASAAASASALASECHQPHLIDVAATCMQCNATPLPTSPPLPPRRTPSANCCPRNETYLLSKPCALRTCTPGFSTRVGQADREAAPDPVLLILVLGEYILQSHLFLCNAVPFRPCSTSFGPSPPTQELRL
jgi:hypothetical protein